MGSKATRSVQPSEDSSTRTFSSPPAGSTVQSLWNELVLVRDELEELKSRQGEGSTEEEEDDDEDSEEDDEESESSGDQEGSTCTRRHFGSPLTFQVLTLKEAYEELGVSADTALNEIEEAAENAFGVCMTKESKNWSDVSFKNGAAFAVAAEFHSGPKGSNRILDLLDRIIRQETIVYYSTCQFEGLDSTTVSTLDIIVKSLNRERGIPSHMSLFELPKALAVIGIEADFEDVDLIKKFDGFWLKRDMLISQNMAGAFFTVCCHRNTDKLYSTIIRRLLLLELSIHLSRIPFPKVIGDPTSLVKVFIQENPFALTIHSLETARKILGVKKDTLPKDILQRWGSKMMKDKNEETILSEFQEAAMFRVACSSKDPDCLHTFGANFLECQLGNYILGLELNDDIKGFLLFQVRQNFSSKTGSLRAVLNTLEEKLKVSSAVIADLRKKTNSTLPSKFALAQISIDQARKREEEDKLLISELKEQLKKMEEQEMGLLRELDRERREKERRENFLSGVKESSTSSNPTSVSQFDQPTLPSTASTINLNFVVQRLSAELKLANDQVSSKTAENTELLLRLGGVSFD